MTERSWPWGGTATGDAALPAPYGAPYTDGMWRGLWSYLFQYDRRYQCVVPSARSNLPGNLAVTNPSGTVIRLATGIGLVNGRVYTNDANLDFNTSGDGTYYLVLRESVAAQTVRAALLKNTALTQNDSTWEVKLATITVASGAHTVADERGYALRPRRKELVVQPFSAFYDTGATESPFAQGFYRLEDNETTWVYALFKVPMDMVYPGNLTIAPILYTAGTGNIVASIRVEAGANGENPNTHIYVAPAAAQPIVASRYNASIIYTPPDVAAGDFVHIEWEREGAHAADTIDAPLYIGGFLVEYDTL